MIASLLMACASPEGVRWYGELRQIVHEGRTEARVELSRAVRPHSWGVGALSGLRGEITVWDGEVWLSYPHDGQVEVRREAQSQESATLLVISEVERWKELPLPPSFDSYLAEILDEPTPLRIEAPVTELRWHVVDGSKLAAGAGHDEHVRTATSGVITGETVELVGFFSEEHQGIFTHAGASTHLHVIRRDPPLTAHVDELALGAGGRLWLPAP